jgi:hypothetical protein
LAGLSFFHSRRPHRRSHRGPAFSECPRCQQRQDGQLCGWRCRRFWQPAS